jgi:hypothetical protein
MNVAHSTYVKDKNVYILVAKTKGKNHLEDLRVEEILILKCITKKEGLKVWIGKGH